ncbi:hypothetical protein ACFSKN_08130 [Mariniflexile gromovii]|uniref:Uncharacterized protein n=1 Tax=Mariniflexile gromovii TaxID=362523 RepID=A0ABS4BVZ6_9FLAO|nr:hypothetical protein [Mariniflexile gromovii]MBP0904181.1 hypothetical protein [Mariniflexile gromovii]
MDNVIEFLENFFQVEADASFTAQQDNNFKDANEKAILLYSFCVEALKNNLGVIIREYPKPKMPSFIPVPPAPTEPFKKRILFKLSEYKSKSKRFDNIYIAFCSVMNQEQDGYLSIDILFLVTKIGQEFKIARNYIYDEEANNDWHGTSWHENEGAKGVDLWNLGEFVKTKRLISPQDSELSMKLYNQNI